MAPELNNAKAGQTLFAAALASSVSPARVQANPQAPLCDEDPESPLGTDKVTHCTDDQSPMGWALLRTAMGFVRYASNGSHRHQAAAVPPEDDKKGDSERAFAIADSLELGLARETPTDFTMPLRRSRKLWRFRVIRSEDKLKARMVTDVGDFLMYAQAFLEARRIGFFLYDPGSDGQQLYDPAAPAFTLHYNETRTEWRLVQERCQNCMLAPPHLSCSSLGKQQLAVARHFRRQVGDGLSNCMEVVVPGIYANNTAVVWCPMLRRQDLGATHKEGDHSTQRLITKLPAWNEDVESLVLDFKGRNVVASAKNFQLALEQKPHHTLCQFGKIGNTTYGLDFKYPLSAAQAFGMAMSTLYW
eukprot:CAMPEP_0172721132 /NCGR_PEP_ID=MMETSP1074-20121228/78388_1 /TAXON_ID=2916 /ORGANISM="Ceratium fusus, Strain PA161109" /LENGTH=358 /DNA_ID=CAMNT_0013546799 /DNA_START=32 /DNA_END=1105 /DNA_ORIENTATION=-